MRIGQACQTGRPEERVSFLTELGNNGTFFVTLFRAWSCGYVSHEVLSVKYKIIHDAIQ